MGYTYSQTETRFFNYAVTPCLLFRILFFSLICQLKFQLVPMLQSPMSTKLSQPIDSSRNQNETHLYIVYSIDLKYIPVVAVSIRLRSPEVICNGIIYSYTYAFSISRLVLIKFPGFSDGFCVAV